MPVSDERLLIKVFEDLTNELKNINETLERIDNELVKINTTIKWKR